MDAIFQTKFSNGFSWRKMCEFRLKFHRSLSLGVQLTISQHWLVYGCISYMRHSARPQWVEVIRFQLIHLRFSVFAESNVYEEKEQLSHEFTHSHHPPWGSPHEAGVGLHSKVLDSHRPMGAPHGWPWNRDTRPMDYGPSPRPRLENRHIENHRHIGGNIPLHPPVRHQMKQRKKPVDPDVAKYMEWLESKMRKLEASHSHSPPHTDRPGSLHKLASRIPPHLLRVFAQAQLNHHPDIIRTYRERPGTVELRNLENHRHEVGPTITAPTLKPSAGYNKLRSHSEIDRDRPRQPFKLTPDWYDGGLDITPERLNPRSRWFQLYVAGESSAYPPIKRRFRHDDVWDDDDFQRKYLRIRAETAAHGMVLNRRLGPRASVERKAKKGTARRGSLVPPSASTDSHGNIYYHENTYGSQLAKRPYERVKTRQKANSSRTSGYSRIPIAMIGTDKVGGDYVMASAPPEKRRAYGHTKDGELLSSDEEEVDRSNSTRVLPQDGRRASLKWFYANWQRKDNLGSSGSLGLVRGTVEKKKMKKKEEFTPLGKRPNGHITLW